MSRTVNPCSSDQTSQSFRLPSGNVVVFRHPCAATPWITSMPRSSAVPPRSARHFGNFFSAGSAWARRSASHASRQPCVFCPAGAQENALQPVRGSSPTGSRSKSREPGPSQQERRPGTAAGASTTFALALLVFQKISSPATGSRICEWLFPSAPTQRSKCRPCESCATTRICSWIGFGLPS